MTYSAFTGWTGLVPTPHGPHAPFIPKAVAGAAWTLRPATPDDEPEIRALLRAEGMNTTGLHHGEVVVACAGAMVVGAAQVRPHRDGSCELDSLVVAPGFRGQGIGTALVRTLLACEHGRLHAITSHGGAATYERLGFRRVPGRVVPRVVRRNLRIVQLAGLAARLRGRHPPLLCLLERPEQAEQTGLA